MSDTQERQSTPAPPPELPAPVARLVVDAVYQDGVIKPLSPLDLPSGTPISLQIVTGVTAVVTPQTNGAVAGRRTWPGALPRFAQLRRPLAETGLLAAFTWLELLALAVALLFYTITRFVGLTQFPIYFFCDEAIQATLAEKLLGNGLRDTSGIFLPPYLQNDKQWNLSLSVYLNLLSLSLFGKSIFVTRATSVVVTILGAVAIALTLKLIFKNRLWWVAPLALGILPAWFLHARTAFETVLMVSFYACFLCCYLLYRYRSPRYLPAALIFGAATFYSYANGQGVMLISGVLLLLSDVRYHLEQIRQRPRLALGGALLLLGLAMPYLRHRFVLHPDAVEGQLRVINSYWTEPIPLSEKLERFARTYAWGLSPAYWFLPNDTDLIRHRWKDSGHLPLTLLPFILTGLLICLWRWRSAAHRVVLVALLAAPFSAALGTILVTRVLAIVVPATLLACIGLDQVGRWATRWMRPPVFAALCAVLLASGNAGLLRAALRDAPTWYENYGLYGMQYGAEQLFSAILQQLLTSPEGTIIVSPSWSNNPNVYLDFFLIGAQRERVRFSSIDSYLIQKQDIGANDLYVVTPEEYERAQASDKLVLNPPERVIPYPDGRPGFYFIRVRYVDGVDALFQADREARRQLKQETVTINGEPVTVRYSMLDMGNIADAFDGQTPTLARGFEANPFVVELAFDQPRTLRGISLDLARMNFGVKIVATPPDGSAPIELTTPVYQNLPGEPHVDIDLPGGPRSVSLLRVEITNIDSGETAHIHLRELTLR